MKIFFTSYFLCLVFLGIADFLWLGTMTNKIYSPLMGKLLRPDIQALPAILFYLIFALVINKLVVIPAIETGNLKSLLLNAALFGLATYGTYNLSAWAVIADWSPKLSIIDIFWGITASIITSIFPYLIITHTKLGN